MADSVRISQLELIDRLTIDDIIVVNNENVNTNSIKFSNVMNSIQEYPSLNFQGSVVFSGNVSLPATTVLNKALGDLTDVTLINPAADQLVRYNGVTWTNVNVSDLDFQMNIDSLLDVVVLAPTANQILVYNGASWTNLDNPSYTKAEADALLNAKVSYTGLSVVAAPATDGGALTYNDANGQFTFAPDSNENSAAVTDVNTMIGSPLVEGDLGTFAGTTLNDNLSVKGAIQELETALENVNTVDFADIYTLFGVTEGVTNLGSFTGGIISSNVSVRVALQELETSQAATVVSSGNNSNAIDNLIAALNAIGADGGVTDIATLKTALTGLTRSNT